LTALKRALLLHDELVFVDAVSPEERADLYAREAAVDPDIDAALARRWRAVEPHYRLLEEERVVRTVDPATLFDLDGVVGEITQGLEVDLDRNGAANLFGRRKPWSMLERRLPGGGADGPLKPWLADRVRGQWTGEPVAKVSYAVGSSMSLSIALASSHALGATLITDSERHHQLHALRLGAAPGAAVPGLRAPTPSPLARQLIELRVIDALAAAEQIRSMSVERVLEYRNEYAAARRELIDWLDKLTAEARSRPWDPSFETELREIANHAREIAADPGRFGVVATGVKHHLSSGVFITGAFSAMLAFVVPGVSEFAAFALGSFSASSVTGRVLDDLRAKRPPERNAVSYLLNARAR
jgi:hypothetical protein